ncbi:MAG: von Willebrand factor type A domain-containing protein [Lautropia sp.]
MRSFADSFRPATPLRPRQPRRRAAPPAPPRASRLRSCPPALSALAFGALVLAGCAGSQAPQAPSDATTTQAQTATGQTTTPAQTTHPAQTTAPAQTTSPVRTPAEASAAGVDTTATRPPVPPDAVSPATGAAGNAASGRAADQARSMIAAESRRFERSADLALRPAPGIAPAPDWMRPLPPADRERYQALQPNPVLQVAQAPVSTFSVDVDTGSWSNVRRMLNAGRLPPTDAVRIEEMINYFPYDDPRPNGATPFAVRTELARAPWNAERLLMRVAITGENRALETLPPVNLVFLVDVSGSMSSPDKLPLLKSSLKLLTERLRPQDRIAIVTYAGTTAVTLPATSGTERARIGNAIDSLRASGSTAGASGIELAYQVARQGFIAGGINRILLATDGDFNVGVTDFRQLKDMVAERRASGVSLSTLGFGTGNYNERLMEQLADAGDGAYSYIDNLMEGHKVLVNEMTSTLATIAKDVKVQVEFNPAVIKEYRLIGYENRMLAREDFNNDRVDAGDIGAGHSVTALYELTPVGAAGAVDPLRYAPAGDSRERAANAAAATAEVAFVRLRYKRPDETASRLIEHPVPNEAARDIAAASAEFRFATAIAGFGQLLRGGTHTGNWRIADARALAAASVGADRFGYRAEAVRLIDLAGALATHAARPTPGGG